MRSSLILPQTPLVRYSPYPSPISKILLRGVLVTTKSNMAADYQGNEDK